MKRVWLQLSVWVCCALMLVGLVGSDCVYQAISNAEF